MKHIHTVAHKSLKLNNEGAKQIQNGSYAEAIHSLSNALDHVKEAIAYCETDAVDTNEISIMLRRLLHNHQSSVVNAEIESVSSLSSSPCCCSADKLSAPSQRDLGGSHHHHHHDSPRVYPYPIFFDCELQGRSTYILLAIVVTFNFGLVNHLFGIKTNTATSLEVALHLYDLSQSMLTKTLILEPQIFTLAILNNSAHIYTLLQRTDKARECSEKLLVTLSGYTTTSGGDDDTFIATRGYYDFLRTRNILHLILSDPYTSPSA